MYNFLVYLFWPNPANATYGSPKAMALLIFCALLTLSSFGISAWRKRVKSGVTRKLSRSWATAAFWFGLTGLIMVVARAEEIQFLSMRFLWVIWLALAILFLVLQVRVFRARYYEVVPTVKVDDPLGKYLPGRKR